MKSFKDKLINACKSDIFWQNVAIVCLCLYSFWEIIGNVSLVSGSLKEIVNTYPLIPVVGIVILVRLCLNRGKKWLIPGITLFIIVIVCDNFVPTQYYQLLIPVFFSLALINVQYKKILKPVLITAFLTMAMIIFLSRSGLATNLVYLTGKSIRMSMGFVYCTDYAALIFYMVVIALAAASNVPNIFCAFISLVCGIMVYYLQRGTCSAICFFITSIGYIYYSFNVLMDGRGHLVIFRKKFNALIGIIEQYLFIAMALLITVLSVLYGTKESWVLTADEKLHSRLYLGFRALTEYGLSLFGNQNFQQVGNGCTTHSRSDYFFLDSSYMYTLIYYGFIILLIIGAYFFCYVKRVRKSGNYRVLLAIAVICIHAFEEHHFIEPWYNLLSCMILADYGAAECGRNGEIITNVYADGKKYFAADIVRLHIKTAKEKLEKILKREKKTDYIIAGILIATAAFECFYGFDRLFSYLRVLSDCKSEIWPVLVFICCFGLGFVFAVRFIKTHKKGVLIIGCILFAASAALQIYFSTDVRKYKSGYELEIAEDTDILKQLYEADEEGESSSGIISSHFGRIYAESASCFYGEYSKYLSDSFFYDTELAKKNGITYLCDATTEKRAFTVNGFKMFMYGKNRIGYTNSGAVIDKLKSCGYEIYDVFPYEYVLFSDAEDTFGDENGSFVSDKTETPYGMYSFTINFDISQMKDCSDEAVVCSYCLIDSSAGKNNEITFGDITDGVYNVNVYCYDTGNVQLTLSIGQCSGVHINNASLQILPSEDESDDADKPDTIPLGEVLRMIKVHW